MSNADQIKKTKEVLEKYKENEQLLDEYQALMLAMDEEDILMEEITQLIETSTDKKETEKIIYEKYLPLLKECEKNTRKAFIRWRKSISEEIKEIEDLMNQMDHLKDV